MWRAFQLYAPESLVQLTLDQFQSKLRRLEIVVVFRVINKCAGLFFLYFILKLPSSAFCSSSSSRAPSWIEARCDASEVASFKSASSLADS